MDSKQTSGTPTGVPSGDLFATLVEKCRLAEVPKVYASTQYRMGFILAATGPNVGGIVFRDDMLPHAARERLADRLNAALADNVI